MLTNYWMSKETFTFNMLVNVSKSPRFGSCIFMKLCTVYKLIFLLLKHYPPLCMPCKFLFLFRINTGIWRVLWTGISLNLFWVHLVILSLVSFFVFYGDLLRTHRVYFLGLWSIQGNLLLLAFYPCPQLLCLHLISSLVSLSLFVCLTFLSLW